MVLSTPHGTLGTSLKHLEKRLQSILPFNSTRYIRNIPQKSFLVVAPADLSTPHGTLGTMNYRRENLKNPLLILSTPHGTLGTWPDYQNYRGLSPAFNSTRYIRNETTKLWLHLQGYPFNSTRYIRNMITGF